MATLYFRIEEKTVTLLIWYSHCSILTVADLVQSQKINMEGVPHSGMNIYRQAMKMTGDVHQYRLPL